MYKKTAQKEKAIKTNLNRNEVITLKTMCYMRKINSFVPQTTLKKKKDRFNVKKQDYILTKKEKGIVLLSLTHTRGHFPSDFLMANGGS